MLKVRTSQIAVEQHLELAAFLQGLDPLPLDVLPVCHHGDCAAEDELEQWGRRLENVSGGAQADDEPPIAEVLSDNPSKG
eukprot:4385477-Pyramimonas_sp.AAC.1